ncbi:thioredoxin domain-containing protein [Hydrogenimonas sp.]
MRYCILIPILLSLLTGGDLKQTNRLIDEPSPYLQQHAHNPVDWYPWGEEAFEKARREHKPIFLSIGYSTCHWCHVMEEESFENEEIAELINRWFIPIKVDREQMPHLDRHFQRVYTLLHRRGGGWPLTIFLTEDLKPFYAATYIPPVDSYGVKGMKSLLPALGSLYASNPEAVERRAEAIETLMKRAQTLPSGTLDEGVEIAERAVERIETYYDAVHGGFGDRPKFPESSRIRLLLAIYRLDGNEKAKEMALHTLDAMARSGLYDQVDGAFFRYCVDRAWRMPHFEKMLYTNAELIPLYVEAWKMTGDPRFREVVERTIAEIDRRFRTPEGLYFSASDADSDGEEGGYFLYRYAEALKALQEAGFAGERARELLESLAIREDGSFDSDLSHVRRLSQEDSADLKRALSVLKRMRESRRYPFVDRKVITAWNAMMVKALFAASDLNASYLAEAERSYRALKGTMERNGSLFHQTLYGRKPTQPGILEDYAFMVDAALAGYQKRLDEAYLEDARRMAREGIGRFYRKEGRWLLGDDRFESYADLQDSYYSSPLSVMLNDLLSLAVLEGSTEYGAIAKRTLERYARLLKERPDAYPEALRAYLRLKKGVVVIKGSRERLLQSRRKLAAIGRPFVLLSAAKSPLFLACDESSCFAYAKELDRVIEAVRKR